MKVAILTTDDRESTRDYSKPTPFFGSAPESLLQGFAEIPEEIEVHIISCLLEVVPSYHRVASNIHYHGLHVPSLGRRRTLYAGRVLKVREKLREIQPKIVHAQGTERDNSVSAIFSGYPNVITIHGNMRQIAKKLGASRFSPLGMTAMLEGWTLPRTDGIICLTSYTQKQVETRAKRTWILPNAANNAYFDVQRSSAPKNVILCVSNIVPYKNQVALIRSLDPVADSAGIRLVFLGKTYEGDRYSAEFLALIKSRPWCVHRGFRSVEELKSDLASAQLLIHPSLEDNCPMVVLEAAAAGVPVAASRIGGIPDLIVHGETGLLFDPHNLEEIRESALRLFKDQSFSERVSAAAKKHALEHFHPRAVARGHLEIYRDLLSKLS